KIKLLTTIKRYKEKSNFKLYGYCFMDNHIHLLMQEMDETVSQTIQRIGASYVYWYNSKYVRCGHLFQDRFKREIVETADDFIQFIRYIQSSPLKYRLAKYGIGCKWTRSKAYWAKSGMVDTDPYLKLFSHHPQKSIQLFIHYMQDSNNDE